MRKAELWWSLPGPARFVDSLLSDLRSGRNLVIALPEHHPPGLRSALGKKASRLRPTLLPRVRSVWQRGGRGSPIARTVSSQTTSPNKDPCIPPSARLLSLAPALGGSVLWIDGITDQTSSVWLQFLEEYKNACRVRREYERFLLVVPLVGTSAERPPKEELALGVHRWEGVVGRIDMLLYTTALLDLAHLSPLLQDLATAVTVEVSGTDPLLVDRLVRAPLESILEPLDIVCDEAHQRGWREVSSPCWHRGMIDRVNGKKLVHSDAEVAAKSLETVGRRVWRGQVAVLFPFLEDHRLRFAQMYRPLLHTPIRTEFETINDHESLELSHRSDQLRGKIAARKLEMLESCLRIRNDLAHVRPLGGTCAPLADHHRACRSRMSNRRLGIGRDVEQRDEHGL